MITRRAIAAFVVCSCSAAAAAAETPSDEELIQLCIAEIESREGPDASQGTPSVVSSDVTRTEQQQVVHVQLSYSEGRLIGGRCVIRDGEVYDFKD